MSAFQKKAEAQTKEVIGQMLGDQELVEEARAEYRRAADESDSSGGQSIVGDRKQPDGNGQEKPVSRVDRGSN